MSDQSPPPKPKPGSLRDRIAAFENKGAPGVPPAPPQLRPKPGGLQWKPRPPSPPTSPEHVQSGDRKPPSTGGMSASDAMESIGRAGSLKERMAALQGKGAFGGPPPPVAPKPNLERPKWKPPPPVPAPASPEDEPKEGIAGVDVGGRDASRSPPPRAVASPTPENQPASYRDGDAVAQEGDGGNPDPEEEERQRRAAIAARMARLGGARFGMGPPIFTPKPVTRKSEPAPPAPEANEEVHGDQPTVIKESSQAFASSPSHDLPAAATPVPETIAETECKDEPESPPPVPTRVPTSMPVPAVPRRAAPPRKKSSKTAPTTALPEPPVEEAEIQSPPITDEPHASADRAVHDESLTAGDSQKETGEVVEATYDQHLDITADAEPRHMPPPAFTEAFHGHVEEAKKQEAEEEFVAGAGSHVEEESTHTAADDQEVPSEQPPDTIDVEEEEEARRQCVAAKLAQMGAFNPLAGPPPIPSRSFDEQPSEAPLDVEDEVNVDTEEYGETIPSPPAVPARHDVQSIKRDAAEPHVETDQDDTKVDEDDRAPAHRDGERPVASYAEEPSDRYDGHTLPSPEYFEDASTERDSDQVRARQEAAAYDVSGTGDLSARSSTTEIEHDTSKYGAEPPRITRPIPPLPVNLRFKPTPPSSPPLSPPPKTPLQVLRVDEEECPPSPDVPPRPVPPPGRSASMAEGALLQPRRRSSVRVTDSLAGTPSSPPLVPTRSASVTEDALLQPWRRTSVRTAGPLAETPSSPPPLPTKSTLVTEDAVLQPRRRTSARVTETPSSLPTVTISINRRPATPPIITTLAVQEQVAPEEYEQEHVAEEEPLESTTPQPDAQEDEASVRRRAIAERMARLGGIRFGAPPPMNPLSRPPLPPAPPPTSIPPDETESENKEEEDEVVRKQRIATKLAGMGGMRLGMLPPGTGLPPASARRPMARQEDSESEDAVPPVPVPAPPQRSPPARKPPPPIEESEQAGRESRGMSDDGVQVEAEESELEEVRYSDVEGPLMSEEEDAPALPAPRRSTQTARSAEALPTPPPRMTSRSPPPGRPPIPTIPTALLGRQPSATAGSGSVSSSRQASLDESSPGETPTVSVRVSESAFRLQSEYVMVEAEVEPDEDDAPALPRRRASTRGGPTRSIPLPPVPPPSAVDPPEALTSSAQWELPSILQGVVFGEGSEMASSGWSEGSTAVHVPAPALSLSPPGSSKVVLPSSSTSVSIPGSATGSGSGSGSGQRSTDQQPQLTTDELMAIWGKTGVRVVNAATALFEKSKRALVGDGSYAGFVRAVLAQVSGVAYPYPSTEGGNDDDDAWGYVVYAQTGSAVQRRVSEILPGDVVAFRDAKLKGHKGLHAYTQIVGAAGERGGGPVVGIVSEFDGKKSKVRVWQANQHVGQQTVEIVSYRLEDLKSGQVKVYRVLEA